MPKISLHFIRGKCSYKICNLKYETIKAQINIVMFLPGGEEWIRENDEYAAFAPAFLLYTSPLLLLPSPL